MNADIERINGRLALQPSNWRFAVHSTPRTQREAGLPATGIVDDHSQDHLDWLVIGVAIGITCSVALMQGWFA